MRDSFLMALLLMAGLTACSESAGDPDAAGSKPGRPDAAAVADAMVPGPADAALPPEDDAGVSGEDAGEPADAAEAPGADAGSFDSGPVRQLTTWTPLGATSATNRFLSPGFDEEAFGWFAYLESGGSEPVMRRHVAARSMAGLPVLEVDGQGRAAVLVGLVRGGRPPLEVEVWVGHPRFTGETPLPITVSLVGFAPSVSQHDTTFPVDLDLTSKRTLDGVVWRRYATTIAEELLGYATLTVREANGTTMFVTGASLEQSTARSARAALHRPPAPHEQEALRLARAKIWQLPRGPAVLPVGIKARVEQKARAQ